MTATEALHFYNSEKRPTNKWIKQHYSHFWPTRADEKARKELHVPKKRRKRVMKEFV